MHIIEVTGCSDSRMWYADQVGKQFILKYDDYEEGSFVVIDVHGYNNIIKHEDGEMLELEA